jgi:hypothetical protein
LGTPGREKWKLDQNRLGLILERRVRRRLKDFEDFLSYPLL